MSVYDQTKVPHRQHNPPLWHRLKVEVAKNDVAGRQISYQGNFGSREYNCLISPNHTLQLTTHRTSVRESLKPQLKKMIFLTKAGHYICKIMVVIVFKQL